MSASEAFLEHFVLIISIITVQNINQHESHGEPLAVAGELELNYAFVV